MALGQGIHDILKYKDIAEAGQPQSLTGEALVQLGALFTQMDFDFSKDEDTPKIDEGPKKTIADVSPKGLEFEHVTNRKNAKDILANWSPTVLPPKKVYTPKDDNKKVHLPNTMVGGLQWEIGKNQFYDKSVVDRPLTPNDAGVSTTNIPKEPRLSDEDLRALLVNFNRGKVTKAQIPAYEDYKANGRINESLLPVAQQPQEQPQKQTFTKEYIESLERNFSKGKYSKTEKPAYDNYKVTGKIDTSFFRFKDNNPIKRLQQHHPQILETLQGLRYKQPSEVDSPLFRAAHIASSPFVKTDGVDYRYMKRATMPEYAKGSLGSAAAEGYNLVIDKRNYDQAVKKDYETELDDEMGDLNIEADTINEQTRKDYLELSMNKKQKFNSLFQAYANSEISKLDFENGKAALVSELDAVAGAQTNLTKLRTDYLENKGTYHIDASKPEIVDFYNTLEKNPESFTMKTIDDIDYFIGSTRQGKEVKVPTSKIANGTAGFRLVEKASITPVVASALKAVGTYSEEGMTDYGFGKKSASPEKAKEIGMANIKNALAQDESKLRSFMASIYGVDHETYKNFIGDDPTANREEMLNDAADHLYETQVKPQFFPTQQTSRIDPSKVTFGGKTQRGSVAERNRAANVARLNQMGNITPSNFNNVESEIDLTKYSLVEQEGAYYVTDKKGNVLTQLNLSNQQDTKSKLLNFMKGGGGIGQKSNQTESDPLGIN